jgi:quercetin dioxygenase-like cupin family protein
MTTIVRTSGEGEQRWFYGGGIHTWKVLAEQTNGAVTIFEDSLERGKMTPLHTHPEHDEIVFVLEGEILVHANGEPRKVTAGGLVVTPRGVAHAFAVTSERARLLAIATPGSKAESFYRGASTEGTSGAVDFTKVGDVAKKTGATAFIGPPPFDVKK